MKRLLLIGLIIMSFPAHSQTKPIPTNKVYDLDKAGNDSTMTSNTAIWQGKKHAVWSTPRGALFIPAYTKAGKYYRKYIKQA